MGGCIHSPPLLDCTVQELTKLRDAVRPRHVHFSAHGHPADPFYILLRSHWHAVFCRHTAGRAVHGQPGGLFLWDDGADDHVELSRCYAASILVEASLLLVFRDLLAAGYVYHLEPDACHNLFKLQEFFRETNWRQAGVEIIVLFRQVRRAFRWQGLSRWSLDVQGIPADSHPRRPQRQRNLNAGTGTNYCCSV